MLTCRRGTCHHAASAASGTPIDHPAISRRPVIAAN
jgi:hypothetical protein